MSKAEKIMVAVLFVIITSLFLLFGADLFPNVEWSQVPGLLWKSIARNYR